MSHQAPVAKFGTLSAAPTCGTCGVTVDLGRIAAHYRNPLKQAAWSLIGKRLAARRTESWNAHVASHTPPTAQE